MTRDAQSIRAASPASERAGISIPAHCRARQGSVAQRSRAPRKRARRRKEVVILGRLHKLRRNIRAFGLLGVVALLASGCGGGAAHQSVPSRPGLQTIFEAPIQLFADPARTLDLMRRLGVARVRVFMAWGSIAPHSNSPIAPKSFDAASPAAYPPAAWAPYDAIVRDAAQRGVGVDLDLVAPPPLWASGRGAPRGETRPRNGSRRPASMAYSCARSRRATAGLT